MNTIAILLSIVSLECSLVPRVVLAWNRKDNNDYYDGAWAVLGGGVVIGLFIGFCSIVSLHIHFI